MNDSDAAKARVLGFVQIFLNYEFHVAGRDGMQIENICYGNDHRLREWVERVCKIVFATFKISRGRPSLFSRWP